mmetsp:Transcript_129299/g.228695  ORF Transcript_129299/g.228695 Transcript_129299/m.228695 type:complete len:197 (+) Transcript_129299:71-661(+)
MSKRQNNMLVEGGKPYFLGSWCRAPFDPSRFPQSLNLIGGRAHLDNFDASTGNLMIFRFVGGHSSVFSDPRMAAAMQEPRCFTLACINAGETPVYLAPDLSVVNDEGRAQLWEPQPYSGLRNTVPGEIALQIRAHGSDRLLCSDERRRTVCLLRPGDAEVKDSGTGAYVFNDAWEATPDEDPDPETLKSLLKALSY